MRCHFAGLKEEHIDVDCRPAWNAGLHVPADCKQKWHGRKIDRQENTIVTDDRIDAAGLLQKKRDNDKGESPIHDDDAVAQRIEPVRAHEGQRAHEHPQHGHREQKAWQGRKRGDETARAQIDYGSAYQRDLTYENGRDTEIGKALAIHRISEQNHRKKQQITVAPLARSWNARNVCHGSPTETGSSRAAPPRSRRRHAPLPRNHVDQIRYSRSPLRGLPSRLCDRRALSRRLPRKQSFDFYDIPRLESRRLGCLEDGALSISGPRDGDRAPDRDVDHTARVLEFDVAD